MNNIIPMHLYDLGGEYITFLQAEQYFVCPVFNAYSFLVLILCCAALLIRRLPNMSWHKATVINNLHDMLY